MSTRAKPTAAAPPSSLRADNTRNHHHHINNNYAYSTSSSRPTINNPIPFPNHVPSSITSSNTSKPSSAGGGGGSVERERDRDRGERGGGDRGAGARPPPTGPVRSTLLQPRVAVALGVAKQWYPILFLCRLLSIVPGVVFGLPSALRLLAAVHLLYLDRVLDGGALLLVLQRRLGTAGTGGGGGGAGLGGVDAGNGTPSGSSGAGAGPAGSSGFDAAFEARLRLTEALLATIWCCASGYLSFFFTDCLMSRWLLRYTPQATIVRLLTVDAMNGYLTSWVLHLMGGFEDPRLVLPAWIVISTTLTVLYHITQRKINIRKETSMSISVFSIASFVSMVALLAQLHSNRSDYPDIPLLNFIQRASHFAGRLVIRLMEYGDITRDL